MEVFASFVVGYLLCGVGTVMRNTSARMMDRPAWARHPTIGWVLLIILLWWVDPLINSSRSPRDIVAGLVGAAVQLAVVGGGVFACWWLSALVADGFAVRVVLTAVGVFLTQVVISPVVNAVLMVVLMVLAIPLRLLPGVPRDAK